MIESTLIFRVLRLTRHLVDSGHATLTASIYIRKAHSKSQEHLQTLKKLTQKWTLKSSSPLSQMLFIVKRGAAFAVDQTVGQASWPNENVLLLPKTFSTRPSSMIQRPFSKSEAHSKNAKTSTASTDFISLINSQKYTLIDTKKELQESASCTCHIFMPNTAISHVIYGPCFRNCNNFKKKINKKITSFLSFSREVSFRYKIWKTSFAPL